MIVIARNKLKFLQAGRMLTIPDTGRYRLGRTYALGIRHNHTICRIEIIEIHADGLTIRIAPHRDPPRLLAARSQYGYTDNPVRALRDEPEAIPANDLDHLAHQAHARYAQQRGDELAAQQARSLAIRMKEAAGRNDLVEFKALGAQAAGLTAGTADISFS